MKNSSTLQPEVAPTIVSGTCQDLGALAGKSSPHEWDGRPHHEIKKSVRLRSPSLYHHSQAGSRLVALFPFYALRWHKKPQKTPRLVANRKQ